MASYYTDTAKSAMQSFLDTGGTFRSASTTPSPPSVSPQLSARSSADTLAWSEISTISSSTTPTTPVCPTPPPSPPPPTPPGQTRCHVWNFEKSDDALMNDVQANTPTPTTTTTTTTTKHVSQQQQQQQTNNNQISSNPVVVVVGGGVERNRNKNRVCQNSNSDEKRTTPTPPAPAVAEALADNNNESNNKAPPPAPPPPDGKSATFPTTTSSTTATKKPPPPFLKHIPKLEKMLTEEDRGEEDRASLLRGTGGKAWRQMQADARALRFHKVKIIKRVGSGPVSTVYQAEHTSKKDESGRKPLKLAVKVMDWSCVMGDYQRTVYSCLMKLYERMHSHPNIVKLLMRMVDGSTNFLVLDWCSLGSLHCALGPSGCLARGVAEPMARDLIQQVCQGLLFLHGKDVPHGRLTSENILLDHGFRVKLSDYGYPASSCSNCTDDDLHLQFRAPEMLRGKPFTTFAADIWSLGVVLYVMFHVKVPFNARDLWQAQRNVLTPPLKCRTSLSFTCVQLLKNLLTFNARLRPCLHSVMVDAWVTEQPRVTRPYRHPQCFKDHTSTEATLATTPTTKETHHPHPPPPPPPPLASSSPLPLHSYATPPASSSLPHPPPPAAAAPPPPPPPPPSSQQQRQQQQKQKESGENLEERGGGGGGERSSTSKGERMSNAKNVSRGGVGRSQSQPGQPSASHSGGSEHRMAKSSSSSSQLLSWELSLSSSLVHCPRYTEFPSTLAWKNAFKKHLCDQCRQKDLDEDIVDKRIERYTDEQGRRMTQRMASLLERFNPCPIRGVKGLAEGKETEEETESPQKPANAGPSSAAEVKDQLVQFIRNSERMRAKFFRYYAGVIPPNCREFPLPPVTTFRLQNN